MAERSRGPSCPSFLHALPVQAFGKRDVLGVRSAPVLFGRLTRQSVPTPRGRGTLFDGGRRGQRVEHHSSEAPYADDEIGSRGRAPDAGLCIGTGGSRQSDELLP